METKSRLKISILSGVFCVLEASILGGIAVVVLRAVRSRGHLAALVRFIPVALVFAAIQAVPFGLIVGSIGGWWLAPRATGDIPSRHLFLQSAVLGAVLGSTFPIVAVALGWGPLQNLVSVLPISIGIGTVCGLSLAAVVRKFCFSQAKTRISSPHFD
jgi:hypothetical protein